MKEAGGQIVTLQGRVLDRNGAPISGARVEIWQVDMNARYLHRNDRNDAPRDPAFQGFGHDITDADGRYTFRTIKPVPYPGRTPHIHVKVFARDRQLTTQFYIAGDPNNAGDPLFARMSRDEQRSVEMSFKMDGARETSEVNLVL